MRHRILVVEDDHALRDVLRRGPADEGFEPVPAADGASALRLATDGIGAVVLDVGLPDADGRDVCQALRVHGIDAPVLFLTARSALPDRVSGFHAGGDDYVVKPFALAELLVRIRALLRRRAPTAEPMPGTGLRLDPAVHGVRVGERSAALTPTEYRLLGALAARPGEVVRRRALVAAAWPEGAIVHDNTLDTYIVRLRRKLREVGSEEQIATARGVGYVLR
jgi:two-component system response regulator MprA